MKYVYPAVFTQEGSQTLVSVPDLSGCHTFASSFPEAIEMARDAMSMWLCLAEDRGEEIPSPSENLTSDDGVVSFVDVDTVAYRRQTSNRAVKKTLSLPSWLNEMAESAGLNFSAILQSGIKRELHITD